MTITRTRGGVATVFLAGLAIQAAIFSELVREHALTPHEAWPMLKALALAYAVPLTVILGGVFAPRDSAEGRPRPFTFWFAFGVSALWNLFLVVPAVLYFLSEDALPADVKVALSNSSSYNFLVAGALTYFFSSHKQPARRGAHD